MIDLKILKELEPSVTFSKSWEDFDSSKIRSVKIHSDIFQLDSIFIARGRGLSCVNKAVENGSIAFLTEKINEHLLATDHPVIYVDEVESSLQLLCNHILKNKFIMAITGSSGKTTATTNIALKFSEKVKTHTKFRNYNTLVGLQASISSADPDSQVHIYEVGTDSVGYIQNLLSYTFCPYIAICLSVQYAHSERFKSHHELVEEKLSIATQRTKYFILPKQYAHIAKANYPNIQCKSIEDFYPPEYTCEASLGKIEVYDKFINNLFEFCYSVYSSEFMPSQI